MHCIFNTSPLTVYEHMALDEHIVRVRPQDVSLRFYNWVSGPAVTFGYAQFIREVRCTLKDTHFGGVYTRRPTGGGIVFHTDDLTFSLIFPSIQRPVEIYKTLHGFIWKELSLVGIQGRVVNEKLPVSAYTPSVNHQASACFIRPVENDLLDANNQKFLGGAIRRFGNTVLYQGSLQLPGARTNPLFRRAIIRAVRAFLAVDLQISACPTEILFTAKQIAVAQYAQTNWVEKF